MAQISVIVPVYRVEDYLHRCVDSVLNQTFQDFELILVDDGSPDGCPAICDAYARKDPRVRVIHQKNGGLSAARNAGIDWMMENSDSTWLTFLDSDDWVHPRTLEWMVQALKETGTEICVCGFQETQGESPAVRPEQWKTEVWLPGDFYRERPVDATIACAKLYPRRLFETVRYPVGKVHEDEYVTYRLLFACEKIAVIAAPMYAYYVNPEGITRRAWSEKRLDAWGAYEEQVSFFLRRGDAEMARWRMREYLENALRNLENAQKAENAGELDGTIRKMRKTIRKLLRRAWKLGCITFWVDYEVLSQYYPLWSRLYRFWLERRK